MTAMLAGIAAFGGHVGVGSSYGAFMAPLGHIAARLHAIGQQARTSGGRQRRTGRSSSSARTPGSKTGEDGPTHADPQPLQLLQENFPAGTMITLTPWDPQELWPLFSAALAARPAVIAPFVTRPPETVLDRAALGLAPASAAVEGRLPAARGARPARGRGGAAGQRGHLRVRGAGAAAACSTRASTWTSTASPRPSCSTACRRTRAGGHLPRVRAPRGDGHHGLHAADHGPLDPLRAGPRAHAAPVRARALPGQRPGRHGDRRGGPRRGRRSSRRSGST